MSHTAPVPLLLALLLAACSTAPAAGPAPAPDPTGGAARVAGSDAVNATYRLYVGAESADLLHRIRFGPDGATLEATVPVGEMAVETEGPHGLSTSPDGRYVYMTTGHGVPDGKFWKYHAGPDTLVGEPVLLGRFPATVDLTPDGLYAFVANFNLHGERVPSSVSVVYTPEMLEVKQIETCVMPHGLRVAPDGLHAYSNCMMDDLLVEIDTHTFSVSRLMRVARDREGPVESLAEIHGSRHSPDGPAPGRAGSSGTGSTAPTCSPTWAEPSPDGGVVWVACNRGDWILEIDRESWTVIRTLATSAPGPYNLEVTPDGRRLVATLKPSGTVEVFDLPAGRSLGTVPSSITIPHGVVASPDSRYAFVSVEGVGAEPGRVDVIDLYAVRRVASIEVGQQAGGITFWRMDAPGGAADGGGAARPPVR